MIVGTAEIEVVAIAPGFKDELKEQTDPSLKSLEDDAGVAGANAGANLRDGVRDGTKDIEGDLGEVGANSGMALRDGMKDGTAGLEDDLAQAGALGGLGLRDGVKDGASKLETELGDLGGVAGGNLRKGVEEETGKLGDDLASDGEKAGSGLSKGIGSGLSKLADMAANTGLPIGGLSSKLDEAGKSLQDADHKSSGLNDSLDKLGGYALLGVGAAAAVVGVATVKMAEGMQVADVAIANAEGTSSKFATKVGNDFLDTAGKSRFTGKEMAEAFAPVSAQLKETEGHVLSASESLRFMSSASDLAEAKGISLSASTSTLASVMQVFGLKTTESAHAADVLYQASNATGVSVESFAQQIARMRSRLGDTAGSVGELSATIVDLTHQGITGRGAMSALNTGMNTLLKSSGDVSKATSEQGQAYAAMTPKLRALAREYESGALTTKGYKEATEGLAPAQQQLLTTYTKATTAVETATSKYKELGVNVFDTQGKFVGMASVIDQLSPRFHRMTEQQQLATASTLFGAGAARQMTAIIQAGPAAYDKATEAVEKHGAAQNAAKKYGESLQGETKTLGAELVDVGTKIGEVVIPVVTTMTKDFATASTFVLQHKEILIALGAVVTGVLGTAITVFTVNKMVAFQQSFVKAGQAVGLFSKEVATDTAAVEGSLAKQEIATEKAAATTAEETGQMKLDFEAVGAGAETGAAEVGTAGTAIEGTDASIVTANEAVGASFTAWLGPIALATAALYGIVKAEEAVIGGHLSEILGGNQPGESKREGMAGKETGPYKLHSTGKSERSSLEYLEGAGLSPDAAAGLLGNAAQEGVPSDTGESGLGMFQETGSRRTGLEAFAKAKHEADTSEKAQLEYAVKELHDEYASVLAAANKAKTPQEAASILAGHPERGQSGFENPRESTANYAHREQAAVEALGKGGGAVASTPTIKESASGEKAERAKEKAAEATEKLTEKELKAEEAAKKAALEKEVKGQEKALAGYVSKALAEEARVGTARRAAIAEEVAERKAFTATMTAEEKAGLSQKAAREKATAQREAAEQEKGLAELTKLQVAGQSHSLSTLNSELTKENESALRDLEGKLNATHKSALKELSSELVKTWKEGEKEKATLEAAAAKETLAKEEEASATHNREVLEGDEKHNEEVRKEYLALVEKGESDKATEIGRASTLESDRLGDKAQEITDATKVMLDKQAEVGLSGTAEISARLQTVSDELAAEEDKAINAAKLAQDEAAGKGVIAEAEAAARTSRVEAEAKVKEAQSQREVELAKANANSPAANGATQPMNVYFTINGAGLSAEDVMNEFVWNLKTGAVPIAPGAVPIAPAAPA